MYAFVVGRMVRAGEVYRIVSGSVCSCVSADVITRPLVSVVAAPAFSSFTWIIAIASQ